MWQVFGLVGGGVFCHYGMVYSKGGGILLLDLWVIDAVGFKLMGKVSIQSGVGLGVWGFSEIGEAI